MVRKKGGATVLNKKRVLGRGLASLIDSGDAKSAERGPGHKAGTPDEKFFLCPVGEISPGSTQPRKSFDEAALAELAESVREKGVIEPLIVRKADSGGYELIAGERRLRASKLAGVERVPVVVLEATDEESLEFAIIENVQREDLNAVEEAEAYSSLMDFGLSQEEVATRVGKDRATVANYLRLLKLPSEIKDSLARGAISMGHARAILSVEGHAAMDELCRKIITRGLSVREAERLAADGAKKKKKKSARPAAPSALAPLEDELRELFGTRVRVKDNKGKGKIEIDFYSADERERVIELLRSVGPGSGAF